MQRILGELLDEILGDHTRLGAKAAGTWVENGGAGLINVLKKGGAVPKVVTEASVPAAYCRCWRSATFPLCDGAHAAHNAQTGDNVGPLVLKS